MQPNVTLVYNSGNKNGVCGVGWDLSMGVIGRSTKDGLPTYTTNDTFLHSGELVYIYIDTGDYREYRAKVEGGFIRYRYYYIDDYWEVTGKSGRKIYYGQDKKAKESGKSLDGAATGTYRWYLTKVEDLNGNYMTNVYSGIDITLTISWIPLELKCVNINTNI